MSYHHTQITISTRSGTSSARHGDPESGKRRSKAGSAMRISRRASYWPRHW